MIRSIAFLAAAASFASGTPAQPSASEVIALKAGTIHVVEDGRVLSGGATILVEDGKILAVGADIDIPAGAEVVDYGPDAVIIPGLVAPFSSYALGRPSARTASPGTRAVDGFDLYGTYGNALAGGVTSVYITPAESRLIGGTGAIVKLAGKDFSERVVNATAAIHGAIDKSARNTPGFWTPPIPATVDTGMGYAEPQLARSTMGAIVALSELVTAVRSEDDDAVWEDWVDYARGDLRSLVEAGVPWRLSATEPNEIRALLEFATQHEIPLILDGADAAKDLAAEIAAAGASVVFRVPFQPNRGGRDYGKGRDDRWPSFDTPAALVEAGVPVAIASSSPGDLMFSAALVSRGGLDPAAALRAITLTPAEMHGADARIGSIEVGKDADLCVLTGDPFPGGASVIATWVGGESAWSAPTSSAYVIEVAELHVGDGTVLRPGQLLIDDGRILEVSERVAHPRGAVVVRAAACMPGMIDAFGHLGLEGSSKVPSTDFKLESIVGPGDAVDRRVATYGITTVVLTPRGAAKSGAPVMAYKPASSEPGRQIVGDPVAVRLSWKAPNRLEAGDDVRDLLQKAAEYRQKWSEYEAELAAYTPPAPEPVDEDDEKANESDKEDEDKDKDDEEDDDKKKKKKKKKKGEEELEPDPITGVWKAELESGASVRMALLFAAGSGSGDVRGNLRCAEVSADLITVTGHWVRESKSLELRGLASEGWVTVALVLDDGKLSGTITSLDSVFEIEAERTSKEYVIADRPERRKQKVDEVKPPKGQPKEPRVDDKLEPLRRALDGQLSIVVEVDREDEILDCVDAFEAHGILPILYGADDAHLVADEIAGRVRGVLLSPAIRRYEPKRGTNYRYPHSELQSAGVSVAFHSGAEEGAIELPLAAAYAVANGMSATNAVRALTSAAADMMSIDERVGRLARGLDADLLLLDGPPLAPATSVLRVWVDGEEVH